jgi:competence protein ComEA
MKRICNFLTGVIFLALSGLAFAAPVNINTATPAELSSAIKGVGPKKAEAIVTYRKEHGPFHSIAELAKVKGIGQATIEKNRDDMVVKDK